MEKTFIALNPKHNPYKVQMQSIACFSIRILWALELRGRNPNIRLFRNWYIENACGCGRAANCIPDKVRNMIWNSHPRFYESIHLLRNFLECGKWSRDPYRHSTLVQSFHD